MRKFAVPARLLVVAGVIALAMFGARVASPSQKRIHFSAARVCGTERWTVKTLGDRPSLFPAQRTTIAHLDSLPAPASLPSVRLPFERHVFTITASVTAVRPESDSDLHLLLASGGHTMIAESPAPFCVGRATPVDRRLMARSRAAVAPCASATISGVAFFDFIHGQTGVAPNGIELHPILRFRCQS